MSLPENKTIRNHMEKEQLVTSLLTTFIHINIILGLISDLVF